MRLFSYHPRLLLRTSTLTSSLALVLFAGVAAAQTAPSGEEYSRLRSRIGSETSQISSLSTTIPSPVGFPTVYVGTPDRSTPVENPSAPAATAVAPPAPLLPPVDPAVKQQAMQAIETDARGPYYDPVHTSPAMLSGSEPPPMQGFVPPAPLTASTEYTVAAPSPTVAPAPLPQPSAAAPIETAPVLPVAPAAAELDDHAAEKLTAESKAIVGKIPSKLDQQKAAKSSKMSVKRMTPELKSLVEKSDIETFDSVGLSIKVQRPGLDTNYELNRAYVALMGGESGQAAEIYRNILSTDSQDQDALFGLASVYHRSGDLERARPYYAKLLKVNPDHREGLNNFLILISDEAPEEALAELERLEQRNPQFSPIPAQQALILKKLGYVDRAQDKLIRAIELAPENLSYKYNLAVLLDTTGRYEDASALYRLLIDAALKGDKIPTSLEVIQKRLNFIAALPARPATVGS